LFVFSNWFLLLYDRRGSGLVRGRLLHHPEAQIRKLYRLRNADSLQIDPLLAGSSARRGIGSALGQMARALGAGSVIGVVGSPAKVGYAKCLGYDHVILSDGFEAATADLTEDRGADAVVDQVGGAVRRASLNVLRSPARCTRPAGWLQSAGRWESVERQAEKFGSSGA